MPLQFFPDEPPTSPEFISQVEKELQFSFPLDYRQFLLEHNGGVVWPDNLNNEHSDDEWEHTWIERFSSVQDVLFAYRYDAYNWLIELIKEDEADKYAIDLNKLLVIARCVRGDFMLYLGEEDYGWVYFANYGDGQGFNRTSYASFSSLLQSLKPGEGDGEDNLPTYHIGDKIFELQWFWAGNQIHFDRFEELLQAYGGDPNKIHPVWKRNVVQHYIDYPEVFHFLIQKGAKLDGCFLYVREIHMLKYLLEEAGQDINAPYQCNYPLHEFTQVSSYYESCRNRDLMQYLFKTHPKLDLSITDHEGRSVIDRYQQLEHFIQNWEQRRGNLLK
jgi:hypothetical protein